MQSVLGMVKRYVVVFLLIAAAASSALGCAYVGFGISADDAYVYFQESIQDPGSLLSATANLQSPLGRSAYNTQTATGYVWAGASMPLNGEEGSYAGWGDAYDYALQMDFPSGTQYYTYTPTTYLTDGSLYEAVTDWNNDANYTFDVTLSTPAYDILDEFGYTQSGGAVIDFPPCPLDPRLCSIYNGVQVVVKWGPLVGAAVQALWQIWKQRVPSPYGWPGDDGTVAPSPDWTWQGPGPPGGDGNWVKNNPDGTTESLHPDLNHPAPKGSHWDYKDKSGKSWDVWKDGKMTPKK